MSQQMTAELGSTSACVVCGRFTRSAVNACNATLACRRAAARLRRQLRRGKIGQRAGSPPPLDVPEEWRPAVGYEGLYEVSDQGRVWNLRSCRLLNLRKTEKGYLTVDLRRPGQARRHYRVHRVVAAAFLGPCPEGYEVRHGLGGPGDNSASNLQYGTVAENARDRQAHREYLRRTLAEITEADAVEMYRRFLAGELPARLEREYLAILRHFVNLTRCRETRRDI